MFQECVNQPELETELICSRRWRHARASGGGGGCRWGGRRVQTLPEHSWLSARTPFPPRHRFSLQEQPRQHTPPLRPSCSENRQQVRAKRAQRRADESSGLCCGPACLPHGTTSPPPQKGPNYQRAPAGSSRSRWEQASGGPRGLRDASEQVALEKGPPQRPPGQIWLLPNVTGGVDGLGRPAETGPDKCWDSGSCFNPPRSENDLPAARGPGPGLGRALADIGYRFVCLAYGASFSRARTPETAETRPIRVPEPIKNANVPVVFIVIKEKMLVLSPVVPSPRKPRSSAVEGIWGFGPWFSFR